MFLFPVSNQCVKKAVRRHGVKSVQPEAIDLIKQILAEEIFRLVHRSIQRVDKRGRKLIYLDDFVEALENDEGCHTSITIRDWISTGRGCCLTKQKKIQKTKKTKKVKTDPGVPGARAGKDAASDPSMNQMLQDLGVLGDFGDLGDLGNPGDLGNLGDLDHVAPMDEVTEELVNRRSTLRKRKKNDA